MSENLLARTSLPYCPGCGHGVVTRNVGHALEKLGWSPLDVVVVSDIGCCGLVDGLLRCHTLHGLHGRAVALAMGVRFGSTRRTKVIAIQGDGGATIGLQHVLEAARRNVDMSLIVQNNMVYGMTGGQRSALSAPDFRHEDGEQGVPSYDLCELAIDAGAAFAARAFVGRDREDLWVEAFGTTGFSLIEIVETCSAYGLRKVREIESVAEYPAVELRAPRSAYRLASRVAPSLFESVESVGARFSTDLTRPLGIVIAGSAGETVQTAGRMLATAGMLAGLHATNKGEYPITVGTGFSVAEVILSPRPIHYTAIDHPDVIIAVSEAGLRHVRSRIGPATELVIEQTLSDRPYTDRITAAPFRSHAGSKGAAIAAIATWLQASGTIPVRALTAAAERHPRADALILAIQNGEQTPPPRP